MTEIKLYKTTIKSLKITAMCLPFVVIGIFILTNEPKDKFEGIMPWFITCFFGLGMLIGLIQSMDKRPQIRITEKGIWFRNFRMRFIKWEQVVEAYSVSINDIPWIALVTEETVVSKSKFFNWLDALNKLLGAQKINLNVAQLNIDPIQLTHLINILCEQNVQERRETIRTFKLDRKEFSMSFVKHIFLYVVISLTLLMLSLSHLIVFGFLMLLTGIFALIARYRPDNMKLKNTAITAAWLGFVNLVLVFGTIKLFDPMSQRLGEKLVVAIEDYKAQNNQYPADLNLVSDRLDINQMERLFIEQINYKVIGQTFELEATMLFGKHEKFDPIYREWTSTRRGE